MFSNPEKSLIEPVYITEPIVRTEPKLKRNEPCPCLSGKKYKKCCLELTLELDKMLRSGDHEEPGDLYG